MIRFRVRPLLAIAGFVAVLAMMASAVDARPGGGGSRGSRTFSAPAATKTAPTPAKPIERTMTQPGPASSAAAPAAGASNVGAAAAKPGLFNRPGLLGGLAAGFLGAGLLGMLFGHGLFGNLAGLASILGLVVQVGLIAIVAMLAWRWWQRRSQPAFATAGGAPPMRMTPAASMPRADLSAASNTTGGSFLHPAPEPEPAEPSDEIGVTPADYDAFERLLGEIQAAYSAEDIAALRARATPEMFSYMSEELSEHASQGLVSNLSGVKLLQGDLSEAWREGNVEYATVAMRYEIVDQLIERATRKLVQGEPGPVEVTELWTFMRSRGGTWLLSAIQQTEDEQ